MCFCVCFSFILLTLSSIPIVLSAPASRRLLHRNDVFDALFVVIFFRLLLLLLLLLDVFHVRVYRFTVFSSCSDSFFLAFLVLDDLCKVLLRF